MKHSDKFTALHSFLKETLCSIIGRGQHCQQPSSFTHLYMWRKAETLITDDIIGPAHLTDTFHFLCLGATLSALVHAQTTLPWHSPQPTLSELMTSKAWYPNPSSLHNVVSCLPFPLHVRETESQRKGQTCSSLTNSNLTGDSALKVEQGINGLIIILTLKWNNV